MTSLPSKKPEDPILKEWEALWKRFSEVISFMYDNEGVIDSLKKQVPTSTSRPIKKTLKGQIDEVSHLLIHHQEELVLLVDKATKIGASKGLNIGKTCQHLKQAIGSFNLEAMKKDVDVLKKELK